MESGNIVFIFDTTIDSYIEIVALIASVVCVGPIKFLLVVNRLPESPRKSNFSQNSNLITNYVIMTLVI